MTDQVLIYSNRHKAWWGPDGNNYYSNIHRAGRYNPADTDQWMGRGCGCCLVPEILVPVPSAEILADPAKVEHWSRIARGAATRKAKKAGRTNRWFTKEPGVDADTHTGMTAALAYLCGCDPDEIRFEER